jgi:hypothetical protein
MGGGESGRWVWCGLVALMGLVGLFIAARSGESPVPYWGGIGFFVFAVLFTLLQIKQAFDHHEQRQHH